MAKRKHMDDMRQNLGLEAGDTSRDGEIEKMSPQERLGLICGWHLGDRGWSHTFINWARDAGFKVAP